MSTVLEKPVTPTDVGEKTIKRNLSIPKREAKQMEAITLKLMEFHGLSFSQLHRKFLRDEFKRKYI